jgi:hypothetical protein
VKFVTAIDRKRAYNFCIHLRHKVSNYKPGEGAKIWNHDNRTARKTSRPCLNLPKRKTVVAVAAPPPPVLVVVGLTATCARYQQAGSCAKSNSIYCWIINLHYANTTLRTYIFRTMSVKWGGFMSSARNCVTDATQL